MKISEMYKLLLATTLTLILVVQPALQARAQNVDSPGAESTEADSPEDIATSGDTYVPSFSDLEWLFEAEDAIELSASDRQAIEEGEVDVRVTNYLIYLVTPKEFGGAGLPHVKAQRILRNYSTDGRGRFDRETLDAIGEEDSGIVSAHHSGQAVDISEVGAITCKLVERRHVGGSKTRWQSPKAIKVAWQSRDGISRHPTPKGPSVLEVTGSMTTAGMLQMLNESGEMSYYADFAKGLSLEEILLYAGANILVKELGGGQINFDPRADTLINAIGGGILTKTLPSLPEGTFVAEGNQSIQVGIARAHIEEMLGLPPGSLRGEGWQEILENSGKRTIENSLGLPALWLDTHELKDVTNKETAKAVLNNYKKGDNAFSVVAGTMEKILKNDQAGLVLAGVDILGDALRLDEDDRKILLSAAKAKTHPNINIESVAVDRDIPVAILGKLFSQSSDDHSQALEQLAQYGQDYLRQALVKGLPFEVRSIADGILEDILAGERISLLDLKKKLGAGALSKQSDLSFQAILNIIEGDRDNRTTGVLADLINDQLELEGENALGRDQITAMLQGDGQGVLEKIGGTQADKTLGLQTGTGAKLIRGEIELEKAFEQIFANSVGAILGLNEGTAIALEGDIHLNYGQALAEQRIGLGSGSLSRATGFNQLSEDQKKLFGSNEEQWKDSDIRLGVPLGTTKSFVEGSLNSNQLSRKVGSDSFATFTIDQVWNHFDLDDSMRIKKEEAELLIDTLVNWDNAGVQNKTKSIEAAAAIVGRVFDSRSSFSADTFAAFIKGDTALGTKKLLQEGMRMLAGAIGLSIEDFTKEELDKLTGQLEKAFNDGINFENVRVGTKNVVRKELPGLLQKLAEGTGIPIEHPEDIEKFISGDYRHALEFWSAAMWEEFANKFLPSEYTLTYEELRSAVDFSDEKAINGAALALYNSQTGGSLSIEQFNGLPANQKQTYQDAARKKLMQDNRDSAKYKISDAFLLQAGINIPVEFSRVMMSGTDAERLAMMTDAVFLYLEPELRGLVPGLEQGTLKKLFNGEISAAQVDAIVGSAINQLDISLGPFSSDFVQSFYQFIRSSDRQDFFVNNKYNSMWSYFDSWLGSNLGLDGLPDNFAKSLYYSSQNGFKLDKNLVVNGTTLVPSLESMGKDFVFSKITGWADSAMGLPAGSTFQLYQAITAVTRASQALTAAHAASQGVNVVAGAFSGIPGTGDQLVSNAQANLAQAQAALTVAAISILLNACEACQAFFGSIDKAISAPPGFTNAAVAGAIAAAFGLGIGGLIVAAAIYLFGTYRVDYLCPVPPVDSFALEQFDQPFDKLDFNNYLDPDKDIATTPVPGVDKTTWAWEKRLKVKFIDANDPELWMAWSRYFTGQLLSSTMDFASEQDSFGKPLQVITYRQANVEFFANRSEEAFGPEEKDNDRLGLGFSQNSTKTTDWVHASFGGFF